MALARIITHHPEDAAEVREALQRRGYWVEIVSPSEILDSPAELEISLDRASLEQALAAARDSGVPTLLAPGAVTEPVQETRQPVSVPPEPSAVAETPPPVQAPPAEPFVAAEIATEPFAAAEEAPTEPLTAAEEIEAEPSDSFEALASRAMAWLVATGASCAGTLIRASQSTAQHAGRLSRASARRGIAGAASGRTWLRAQAPRLQKVGGIVGRGTVVALGFAGHALVLLARICVLAMQAAARQAAAARAAFEARHRERQAARRSLAVLTQNSRAPVAAPISSDLVWHSRTAIAPTELPRSPRPRSGRQRDWEIALAGGALAASLLMLAFGLFGTQAPDSQVSAAAPALKQKTARVSAAATPTLSHPKTGLSPSAALPQSDQPVSGTGPVQQQRVKRSRSADDSEPDDYGDEVVVRHFTPVKPVRAGDGVKHMSDGK